MINVKDASASPHVFFTLTVYEPASESDTFLMVRLADCSSDVGINLGDFFKRVPFANHSTSGFGDAINLMLNVTSSSFLTLYS